MIDRLVDSYNNNGTFRNTVKTTVSAAVIYGLGEVASHLSKDPSVRSNIQVATPGLAALVGAYYSRGINHPVARTVAQLALAAFVGYETAGAIAEYNGNVGILKSLRQFFGQDDAQNYSAAAAIGFAVLLKIGVRR